MPPSHLHRAVTPYGCSTVVLTGFTCPATTVVTVMLRALDRVASTMGILAFHCSRPNSATNSRGVRGVPLVGRGSCCDRARVCSLPMQRTCCGFTTMQHALSARSRPSCCSSSSRGNAPHEQHGASEEGRGNRLEQYCQVWMGNSPQSPSTGIAVREREPFVAVCVRLTLLAHQWTKKTQTPPKKHFESAASPAGSRRLPARTALGMQRKGWAAQRGAPARKYNGTHDPQKVGKRGGKASADDTPRFL